VEALLTASQQHPQSTTADQPQQQQLLVTADLQQQMIGADRQLCQILEPDGTIQAGAALYLSGAFPIFSAAVNQSILPVFSRTRFDFLPHPPIQWNFRGGTNFYKKTKKNFLHPIPHPCIFLCS
jgi:hypothetical protein